MAGNKVEGFSLSHAAILDGSTSANAIVGNEAFGDIYGVSNASISPDTGNFDNTGDDAVLSTWYWFNFATITVEAGYIPFDVVALLSGSTQTSSGTGLTARYELPLWEEDSLNQPPRPMIIRMPAKDDDGNTRLLDICLYKVQFSPISFNGPTYKTGLRANYTGRALMSSKNETGGALAKRAVGRLISRGA